MRLINKKIYSKKISKYVTIFDYIDQISIILSARTGRISTISFATTIGAPVGIASPSNLSSSNRDH